jgi:uncharacterized repeat protein (TIGR01451 family)
MQKFITLLGLIFAFVIIFAGTVTAANPNSTAYVQINNTASNTTPTVGQQFNYTVIAANYGPDNANGLQVNDVIPSGLTLNHYKSSPGTNYNNATGVWNIGTLTNGSNASLILYVTPNASVAGQTVTNTATKIAETTYDPAPITAKVKVHVPESNVVLTASNTAANVGKQFTYTITATNYGPDSANGLQVTDIIPSGLIKNGYTASQGTYYLNNIWHIGNLPNGITAWLNLYVIPTASVAEKNITNTATKTAETTYDPSPINASVTLYVPESEVVLTKATSNTTPNVGQQFTYTITAANNGPDDATNLQVTDNIPSGLTLNNYTSSPGTIYDTITGIWNIGTLPTGSNASLYLCVIPNASVAGQTVTNTANKTSEDHYDPASTTASVYVNVFPEAYVVLTKTTSNTAPNVGQQFTYTITAANNGPNDATGLQVTDNIPFGLTLKSYSFSPGTIYNNTIGVWYIGPLLNGTTAWLNLNVIPNASVASQTLTNTATKIAESTYDPAPLNASVSVYVPESDVVITKNTSNTTPNVGQQFNYTITAVNNGPDDATNLQVTDNIPSGLTLNNYTSSSGTTYNNATGVWNIGTLPNSLNASLILYVTPKTILAGVNVTNTAVIISEDQYNPITDTTIINVHVPESKVVLTKSTSNTTPNVGQPFTYTITAANNGPDNATNLQVTDNIASGLTLNNYTSSPGTNYNTITGIWNIGTLPNGSTVWLKLNVTPLPSTTGQTVTNTANKTSEDQYDPSSTTATVNIKVPVEAYVVLNKTASNTTPNVGQQFTYILTAENFSPYTATGVQVTDKIPSGLTLNSYTSSPGTNYNTITGIWNIGTLTNVTTAWLKLNVTPTASVAGVNVTNTATKTAEKQQDPVPKTTSVNVHVLESKVVLTKATSNTTPNVGQPFTYTITAMNNGPDNATNLQVTDKIPSGLTLNNYTSSPGTTYNTITGIWNIGTLTNSSTVWLKLNVTPIPSTTGQTVTNTANKTNEDQYDPSPATATVNIKVPVEAYVVLTKKASNTTPNVGQPFTYTITAKNYSPYTATGVQVTDNISSGLTLNNYTSSTGSTYNTITGIWNIGTLTNGTSAWLKLYVTPTASVAGTNVTNTATKTAEKQKDPAPITTSVTVQVNNTVTISQLTIAAYDVKIYYEHNNALPPNVTISDQTVVSNAQFLKLLTTATLNLNNGVTTPILVQNVNPPINPAGTFQAGNIQESEYLSIAQSIQSFINSNGRAPNYATTSLGNIPFSKLVYMFSKVVNYYGLNNRLPNIVSIN